MEISLFVTETRHMIGNYDLEIFFFRAKHDFKNQRRNDDKHASLEVFYGRFGASFL